jgi:hypothetical protein
MAQVKTYEITTRDILRSADFQHGLADARSGRTPRFDEFEHNFLYEWRRQFAAVAPRGLKVLLSPKRVSSEAVRLVYWEGLFQ